MYISQLMCVCECREDGNHEYGYWIGEMREWFYNGRKEGESMNKREKPNYVWK